MNLILEGDPGAATEERFAVPRDCIHCTPVVTRNRFARVVRSIALSHFKWDTMVGDDCSLAPFALVISGSLWRQLAAWAEELSEELVRVEAELQDRPDLWPELGIPNLLQRMLRNGGGWSPAATRVVRYDFHPTSSGWRISEANTDVPGGYTESSEWPRMMAECLGNYRQIGNPAKRVLESLMNSVTQHGRVCLLAATGYIEDQQIVAYLASLLRDQQVEPIITRPEELRWDGCGRALVPGKSGGVPVDAIFRFYQAEWLSSLSEAAISRLFVEGATPIANPGSAMLTESKRLGAILGKLGVTTPTWKKLAPQSETASFVRACQPHGWVFKRAYSNNGDAVYGVGAGNSGSRRLAAFHSLLRPHDWAIQQEFVTTPMSTPLGPMYPCLGVYTIDGKATGIYGRLSHRPLIDYTAKEVAVLMED